LFLIHRNLPFPERATIAPGNKRDKEHLMLDVVMLVLGLGFFLVAVGYAHACEPPLRRTKMVFDYSLAALVAAGLLCYLIFALLRPERF
jgi:K+-transporting ATPase KdpF subunit